MKTIEEVLIRHFVKRRLENETDKLIAQFMNSALAGSTDRKPK